MKAHLLEERFHLDGDDADSETEFNYQVASFNFHASVYQWLVVSGSLAQYKGTGTINGSGT